MLSKAQDSLATMENHESAMTSLHLDHLGVGHMNTLRKDQREAESAFIAGICFLACGTIALGAIVGALIGSIF